MNTVPEETESKIPEEINKVPEETEVPNESEISINYVQYGTELKHVLTKILHML